jgi:glycosyltransferase involved in cell wall biosynthesis
VPPRQPVEPPVRLAFVGQMRRYKALDALARIVADRPAQEVRLTLSGECSDADLAAELRQIALECDRIRLHAGWRTEAEIECDIDEGDAVILPYRAILNSGAAMLALSRARPIIAPRMGSLVDLEEEIGRDWVHLYEGDLSHTTLAEALRWVRETPRRGTPDLSSHDWDAIGRRTADFMRSL